MMAEETATYRDYNSVDVNAQQFLVIANLELIAGDDFVCITDATLVNDIMNTPVTE